MHTRNALVIGSAGALGRSVVDALVARRWSVYGADIAAGAPVHGLTTCTIRAPDSIKDMTNELQDLVKDRALDLVANVAGGWAGGSVNSDDVAASTDLMLRQSLFTSIAAGHIFAKQGNTGSLLVLTGALAACEPCPDMIAYGTAKAAVHYLTKSIAANPSKLPRDGAVLAILPVTLDTPGNRQAMPDADTSAWTSLSTVAAQLADWGEGHNRPASGSLVAIKTAGQSKQTSFTVFPA